MITLVLTPDRLKLILDALELARIEGKLDAKALREAIKEIHAASEKELPWP